MSTSRLETFRNLRAEIESSILSLATSIDGRSFSFQAAIDGLQLRLGGYVMLEGDDGGALGQVRSLAVAQETAGQVGLAPEEGETQLTAALPIRLARGDGLVLDGDPGPFRDRVIRPATPAEVGGWLERSATKRAQLHTGVLSLAGDVPMSLEAGGFDRHTFLCGQSGSGKSYSLGVLLEQLLLETDLRIVILDPNSDCVRLGEVRDDADPAAAERWKALAENISVRASGKGLHLRFDELDTIAQSALLRLDPIAHREEYAELAALLADRPESFAALAAADRAEARSLRLRIQNLGVEHWGVWAHGATDTVLDALHDESVRCLVVDLGSLGTRDEQALVSESILRRLWEERARRTPMLLVIDEAHNVCPGASEDVLTALATEYAVRIAGEGRKFGLYMLVATQRPAKIHENVLSQCDNLMLMRLNSSADAAFVADVYGFAPPGLIGLSTSFKLGESLVAGKLASHPAIMRFGRRVTREGGADVDASWASA